jgi:hypothetical protein
VHVQVGAVSAGGAHGLENSLQRTGLCERPANIV